MSALLEQVKAADQDFEWYPTTERMVARILARLGSYDRPSSVLDVGAGDGRVLGWFRGDNEHVACYSIEKSTVLQQAQPEWVTPAGTEFFEQDLAALPVDLVFCNPPYSDFEAWALRLIDTAHCFRLFLILPDRWKDSEGIKWALKRREGVATVIASDDFLDAERRARARVDIIEITFGARDDYRRTPQDPFDIWFRENITTFETEREVSDYEATQQTLARLHRLDSIDSLVTAFNEDYERMQNNYKALFSLDAALFKELGVNKEQVRTGLKARMKGLKNVYWTALFDQLGVITSRLSTKTKKHFSDRITQQTAIAFTHGNAHAVVLWALRFANVYFNEQVVDLFRELSTHDGVSNYKSNQRTWEKDGWRYMAKDHSHYALDYRVVLKHFSAIYDPNSFGGSYESPGNLHVSCHQVIDDVIAVFGNLGFPTKDQPSRSRAWLSNVTQTFCAVDGQPLFEVKAFKNGNLHFKFRPAAIRTLNVEAGRLLGWIRSPAEAATELGYSPAEVAQAFGSSAQLTPGGIKLLTA
jgi:SAM-dependent methyltransferase